MNKKFILSTFITSNNKSFWEYIDFADLRSSLSENALNEVDGYFPIESNITYRELDDINYECEWIVSLINYNGDHMLFDEIKSTTELRSRIPQFIAMCESEEYVTLYKQSSLIEI